MACVVQKCYICINLFVQIHLVPSFVWKQFLKKSWSTIGPEVSAGLLAFSLGIKGKKALSLKGESFTATNIPP